MDDEQWKECNAADLEMRAAARQTKRDGLGARPASDWPEWSDVQRLSLETSLAWLKDEPDLYTLADCQDESATDHDAEPRVT